MALEVANFLGQLNKTWPVTGDQIAQGDDQIRLIKAVLQKTFPGMAGEVLRTVGKSAGFTPSVEESTAIYACSAAITITLPALGGVALGTYWFIQAINGAVTLTPSGTETVGGAASATIASGSWALVSKSTTTNWTLLGIPAMTAAAIVAALGSTAVAKATDADTVDGYHAASFVRTVNSVAPTAGNVNVSVPVTSVGGNTGAVTNAQLSASVTAALGYTPANGENYSPTSHTHSNYLGTDIGQATVGSFMLCVPASLAVSGATVAGTSLYAVQIVGSNSLITSQLLSGVRSSTLSGTWRNLQGNAVNTSTVGLFQRIS